MTEQAAKTEQKRADLKSFWLIADACRRAMLQESSASIVYVEPRRVMLCGADFDAVAAVGDALIDLNAEDYLARLKDWRAGVIWPDHAEWTAALIEILSTLTTPSDA